MQNAHTTRENGGRLLQNGAFASGCSVFPGIRRPTGSGSSRPPTAHCKLGVLLGMHKADYGGAEQHYRRAIAIDPEDADAHSNLGMLLAAPKADYGGAEQHDRRAIAIDPECADAHCNLGILLEQRKADCHSAAGQPRPSWCL